MNILISVDDNYLDKAKTMIFSLFHCTKQKLNIYLLNHSLSNGKVEDFKKFIIRKCKANIIVVDVKNTKLDELTLGDNYYSIEMYYRIIAQFELPKDLERILWLDADIIVKKDISKFYNQDFEDKHIVVCQDKNCHSEGISKLKNQLGIDSTHKYFNSGVILMNLNKLRNETALDDIIKVCNELQNKIVYPDQDILNYYYQNKVKYAEHNIYNYQVYENPPKDKKEERNIAIVHYTGCAKPWKFQYINKMSKYYWKIRIQRGYLLEAIYMYVRGFVHRIYYKGTLTLKRKGREE